MKRLLVGNWKMNLLVEEARAFARRFRELAPEWKQENIEVGIAPPFTAISALVHGLSDLSVSIGAQNCHWLNNGAHTGEVSPSMLLELGASLVIVGHSERRQFYGETSKCVALRAQSALKNSLRTIVCVGETAQDYEKGNTSQVVHQQVSASLEGISKEHSRQLVVAYEPVWAIGTGLAATPEIAAKVHLQIRDILLHTFGSNIGEGIPILYGGSTTPENISALVSQKNINGALVGGASLKPDLFAQLIVTAAKADNLS